MKKNRIVRLALAAAFALFLASCNKAPTEPDGDGGGGDTTGTGKNIVERVVDALS